jgi:hypothetical protein
MQHCLEALQNNSKIWHLCIMHKIIVCLYIIMREIGCELIKLLKCCADHCAKYINCKTG